MKMRSVGLVLLFAATSVFGQAPSLPDTVRLTNSNTVFAIDLYKRIRSSDENLFLSPYSISTALAMTYGGARGNTADQMARVLQFPLPPDQLHPAFASIQEQLNETQKAGQIQLQVANSLWPQKGYPLVPEYLDLVKKHYGGGVQAVDYKQDAGGARLVINNWVEDRTRKTIHDMLPAGILNPLTRLVLVNAIHFKGNWAMPFDKTLTENAPFHVTAKKSVQVPMMTAPAEFDYAEDANVQVVSLPYAGNRLSMLVILPRQATGLVRVEEHLTRETLAAWVAGLRRQKVVVMLPRFTMTSQFQLDSVLKAMGMTDAFDANTADFSGMAGPKAGLRIDAVLHKAFLEVNEEGTEAAAATAVVMRLETASISSRPPPVFQADHPFLFLIRDHSGNVLFLGRLSNPPVEVGPTTRK